MITVNEILPLEFAKDKVDASGSVVGLDPASLAALEDITIDGVVELGATTLAALETIELGATTLAALETIELGPTSLAALETVTIVDTAYGNWKSTAASVTGTASQLVPTALTDRLSLTIQNLGAKSIYIGSTNAVTSSTGTKIAAGSQFTEKFSATATIWAVCAGAETASLRISEFAL